MRMSERKESQIAQKRVHLTAGEMSEILELARKESARDTGSPTARSGMTNQTPAARCSGGE